MDVTPRRAASTLGPPAARSPPFRSGPKMVEVRDGEEGARRPYRARAMQNSTMPASAARSGPGGKAASAESAASP